MKLKTLKELEQKNDFEGLPQDNPILDVESYVDAEELRNEVIKWINIGGSFDKLVKEYMRNKIYDNLTEDDLEEFVCKFIEHFFNIIKKDIKIKK